MGPPTSNCKGTEDYTALDTELDSSKTKECEDLCKRQNSKGCCYLASPKGCYWKKNGVSWDPDVEEFGTAVTCDYEDSIQYESMISKQK